MQIIKNTNIINKVDNKCEIKQTNRKMHADFMLHEQMLPSSGHDLKTSLNCFILTTYKSESQPNADVNLK